MKKKKKKINNHKLGYTVNKRSDSTLTQITEKRLLKGRSKVFDFRKFRDRERERRKTYKIKNR